MPKISELPAAPAVTIDDLLAIVNEPGGAPITQKATISQLRDFFMVPNALNGREFSLPRQANSGVNVLMQDALIAYGATNFTGQFYADPVAAFGYNVQSASGIKDLTTDKWASGFWSENDYAVNSGLAATLTGGTTTTSAVVTGASYGVNRYVGWTLYNVTRGISQQVISNTATTLVTAAIAGQVSGDVVQLLRRDAELYLQFGDDYANAGTQSRAIRPVFYTIDKGTLSSHAGAIAVASATNASPPVFTTAAPHGLAVGDYVRFEVLAGGTWGVNLNFRSRRIDQVSSTTTFRIESANSTGFGALTGGNVYLEPDINSNFEASRTSGIQFLSASFRTRSNPSGAPTVDDMLFRCFNGVLELWPAGAVNTRLSLQSASSARGGIAGVSGLTFTYNGLTAGALEAGFSSNLAVQMYDSAGGGAVASAMFYRNSGGWGGATVGAWTGGLSGAVFGVDATGALTSTPAFRVAQRASSLATAFVFSTVASDFSTVQHFIDGVGNWIPRATAGATADTNGFFYIPSVAGVPTGVPANLAGNYANAIPLRYDTTNNRLYSYNGAWRFIGPFV